MAERLSRPADNDADGLIVVGGRAPAAPIADLDLRWVAVTLDGHRFQAAASPADEPVRESAFVTPLELSALDDRGQADLAFGILLPCWTLLGMLDRAIELAARHVQEREQFGQPLASFQGVQFQLTDAEVERAGVDVLASYALWSVATGRPEATADALALGWRHSKRRMSFSGSPINCMVRRGFATKSCCRGCPATANRCAGCRSGSPAHGRP